MKCILMNKEKEILCAEYNSSLAVFTEIYEILNIEYAPLIIKKTYTDNYDNLLAELSSWFRNRGIPQYRDKLDILLKRLNITRQEELLDKAFGLSLSDQYFLKPVNMDLKHKDINFFENNFDSIDFLEATFSNSLQKKLKEVSMNTPNNTTDGILKKTWIVEDNVRYLLKGGYKNDFMQPFNEVIASIISKRLGFEHVEYTLDIVKDKVVSKCPCFINTNQEFITANQIMYKIDSNTPYEKYIEILEKHNIKNAREKVENMYILDFLMLNEDRHLNNFGIIRDVNTLNWIDVAPIFDNGQSLNAISYDTDELIIKGEGRLFYDILNFNDIIKIVKNIKRIDISKLDGLVEDTEELLYKYKKYTHISDDKIFKVCFLLNSRIIKLKEIIEK